MSSQRIDMRAVMVRGATYFRAEDIAEYIRSLGSSEETDVRNRLNKAAETILESTGTLTLRV